MQAFYYKVRYEGQHINHGLAATLGHRPLDKHSSLSAKWTVRTDGNVWWGELSRHSYRVSFIYIANPNNLPNSTNTALRIFFNEEINHGAPLVLTGIYYAYNIKGKRVLWSRRICHN